MGCGCVFSEFGIGRRREFRTHDLVTKTIYEGYQQVCAKEGTTPEGNTAGTRNAFFTIKYNVPAISTIITCYWYNC